MSLMYEVAALNAAMIKAAEACRQDMPEGEKVNAVLACFAGMKPVEAEPVVHARWVRGRKGRTVCSECWASLPTYGCENPETGEEWEEEIDETPFCPFCGADME